MHAVMLADLASTIALHGPNLLSRGEPVPAAALQAYWVATRNRCARWHQSLALYNQYEQSADGIGMRSWWDKHQPMMEEVLISEILTRVYAALGAGLDSESDEPEVGPVVHSVYISHLEARNRVLQVMVSSRGSSVDAIARINKLRNSIERWSDVLVGQIAAVYPEAVKYGMTLERTSAFADDANDYGYQSRQTAGWLLSASMRDSLIRQVVGEPANGDCNRNVADSVLICLRPDLFDSHGMMQSLWLYRLRHVAGTTDNVLEQLLTADVSREPMLDGFEAIRDPAFSRRMR